MPVTLTETVKPFDRDRWEPPELPAIDPVNEPWSGVPAFWRESIADRPVDRDRTLRLKDAVGGEWLIGASAGGAPWQGSSYGMPYHLVDSTRLTAQVLDVSKPAVWTWTGPKVPTMPVPLPPVVRREGDPGTAFDCHAFFFDPLKQVLWEAMQLDRAPINWVRSFGRTDWGAGYAGGGGIVRWDCRKPWAAAGQPWGLVAANIPQFPLILRWDQIERGRIGHALFLAVPEYAPEVTGPARSTDGHADHHPLRAGERLRLPYEMVDEYPPGSTERVVAECLAEFGCIVADTAPGAGITMTQDRRFTHGSDRYGPLGPLGLRVSDLVVIKS